MQVLFGFAMHVAAMAVLCVLAECMIPAGKIKSTVRVCIGLLFVLSIASPIFDWLQTDVESIWIWDTGTAAEQQTGSQPETHEDLLRRYYEQTLE